MARLFTPTPILGLGTVASPRVTAQFPRLDMQMDMIASGLLCMQPDGTWNPPPEADAVVEGLALDWGGPFGVKYIDCPDSYMQLFYDAGYFDVWPSAASIAELKVVMADRRNLLQSRFATDGIALPAGAKILDRVQTLLTNATDSANAVLLSRLKNWYLDRLNPAVSGSNNLPAALLDAEGRIRPVLFNALHTYMQNATRIHPAKYSHQAILLAAADELAIGL